MALSCAISSFTWATTDTVGTNFDVTLGFQPDFVYVWFGGPTGESLAGGSIAHGYGFGSSSSARHSVSYISVDAAGNSNLQIRHSSAAICTIVDSDAPGGADSNGDLDIAAEAGWPSDGIRLTVDTQLVGAGSAFVYVMGFGGSDITAANAFSFQEPASTGNQNVAHGLGTTPTGVMFASVGFATAPPQDTNVQGMLMVGASDGTTSGVAFVGGDDGNTTMDTRSYCRTGECIALGPEPAVTLDGRASVSSFNSTNIVLNWSERASTRYIFGVAWAGGQFEVNSITTATNTTAFNGPTLGFVAKGAVFLSACRAASTADTPTDHAVLNHGATDGTTQSAYVSKDRDGVASAQTAVGYDDDDVYINPNITTDGTIDGGMQVNSMAADPMTLQMTVADPSAMFVLLLAWGDAGGTQTPQSVSGTLTTAGALLKETRRALTGTLTTAGALNKRTSRALVGTLTTAGALSKRVNRALTGTLTFAGTLTAVKTALLTLTGTLTTAGALVKHTSRALTGTLTTAGALSKQAQRALTGTLTFAGALAAVKAALRSVAGTLTFAGALTTQAGKTFTATLTLAGTLRAVAQKALAGTLTFTGTLTAVKAALRSVSGTLTFTGTLVAQLGKALSGTLTTAGALTKRTGKVLAGTLSPMGALTAIKATFISLEGTLLTSGALRKQTTRALTGVLTFTGVLATMRPLSLVGTLTFNGSLTASLNPNIQDATADVTVQVRPDVGVIQVQADVGVILVRQDVGDVEV